MNAMTEFRAGLIVEFGTDKPPRCIGTKRGKCGYPLRTMEQKQKRRCEDCYHEVNHKEEAEIC
jgi:hypothetical protein